MEKWLFYVDVACADTDREEEFNRWYDEIHIPDVLSGCPDFLNARRYKQISGNLNYHSYLTIIEIETEDIEKTMNLHRQNGERIRAQGRWSELVKVLTRRLYKLEREL